MASLEKRDLANAIPKLESSFQIDQNPETAYFLAQAQMQQGDCQSAIQSFNLVLENKGTVVEDSVASLHPAGGVQPQHLLWQAGTKHRVRQTFSRSFNDVGQC